MRILVTDANIFIDLLHLRLHGCLFQLGMEVQTTLEVFAELDIEQREQLNEYLENGVFVLYILTPVQLQEIDTTLTVGGLSPQDKTIIYITQKQNAVLVSGDLKMRRYCHNASLEVHGILWLFDQFIDQGHLSPLDAVSSLGDLMKVNTWLPIEECENRIKRWSCLDLSLSTDLDPAIDGESAI